MINQLLGRCLRHVHAGEKRLLWQQPELAAASSELTLRSFAWPAEGPLPLRFAGRGVGDNLSPPLQWGSAPAGVCEWALVLEDPDAPLPKPFVHCLVLGLDPHCLGLAQGALSPGPIGRNGARLGLNSFRQAAYAGPRGLPGHGPHRFVFQLFGLSQPLPETVNNRRSFLQAAAGTVVARARLDVIFDPQASGPT